MRGVGSEHNGECPTPAQANRGGANCPSYYLPVLRRNDPAQWCRFFLGTLNVTFWRLIVLVFRPRRVWTETSLVPSVLCLVRSLLPVLFSETLTTLLWPSASATVALPMMTVFLIFLGFLFFFGF